MTRNEAKQKLIEISQLKEDWNGYNAKSFQSSLIKKCRRILQTLDYIPNIFPTGRNSIQFEYELEDRSYLEFEIYSDKITYLIIPKREYEKAKSGMISNNREEIRQMVRNFFLQNNLHKE